MNKYYFFILTLLITILASCQENDDEYIIKPSEMPNAYILNTGNWGCNDASIMTYNTISNTVFGNLERDMFKARNGVKMNGGLAQDLIHYGSKLYCTLTDSSCIIVMDKTCKEISRVTLKDNDDNLVQPRFIVPYNGYLYVTGYNGCVNKIDTTQYNIVDKVQVGDYPEAMSLSRGKLYVNISGYGMENKVAVVNLSTFTKTKDIEVIQNPYTESHVDKNGNVYIVSLSDYTGNPAATIQKIDPTTDDVTTICNGTFFAINGDYMYVIFSEFALPEEARIFVYNLKTGKTNDFVDIKQFSSVNCITVDPNTGNVYIIDTPYGEDATISIFSPNGTYLNKFNAGAYTCKILFE